jgi:hypothetical protein
MVAIQLFPSVAEWPTIANGIMKQAGIDHKF